MRRPHRPVFLAVVLAFLLTASTGQAESKPGKAAGQEAPASTSVPVISGSSVVGAKLTASTGEWSGVALSYAYQWARCDTLGGSCALLGGATAAEYVLLAADRGTRLRVTVTATNKKGSQSASSEPTGVVTSPTPDPTSPPVSASPPQVSGVAQEGQTLTATSGSWGGSNLTYSYQWKRCDASGAGCANVAGAASPRYAVGSADVSFTLRVAVTATNSAGNATATSSATPLVVAGASVTPSPYGRFGISDAQLVYADGPVRARLFDGLRDVGARWARFDFAWSVIEPQRGQFNWVKADAAVADARARNISVIAGLVYSPAWANGGRSDDKYEPSNPDDFARFAEAVARRYAPLGVKVYELWNEPNLVNFWRPRPNPAKYAELVKLSYARLKAVDKSIVVLAGSMSPVGGYDDANCDGVRGDPVRSDGSINPVNFVELLYRNGGAGSFDALAHHPYEGAGFVRHPCSAWTQMADTSPSLRSLMEANGDAHKKIWATEYGNTLSWASEQDQASRLTTAFDLWLAYPWAGVMTYFNARDNGELFGLVRSDWTQRPAWTAYRNHPKQ